MFTKHEFDRDRKCIHCGIPAIEAVYLKSTLCGIYAERECASRLTGKAPEAPGGEPKGL